MTNKQRQLAKEIVENQGTSMSQAMINVGYSKATAKNPSNVTQSKGWHELMEKYLPDEKLAAKHDELLFAKKVVSAKIVGKDANEQTDDFIEVDDYQTQIKALDLAYKVKGKTQDKSINVQVNNVIPILGELKAE